MHEFSICQSLVDAVVVEMEKAGSSPASLLKAGIAVGALRQVVPEFIEQAYLILTKDTIAEGSQLVIRHVPVGGKCNVCRWAGEMPKDELLCQACRSNQVEITSGTELYLENLELKDDQDLPGGK